jgi:hypothetical protein
MIVSPGRNYIFVHIPKTGGTALALALEARAMKDDILIGDTPKARARRRRLRGVQAAGRLWKHSTLADIAGLVDDEAIARAFVFTLVRNPWERMASYYHWLRGQGFTHPAVALARSLPFGAFLAHPQTAAALAAWPAEAYVRDRHGALRCDLFARLEHLEQDLAPLEAHLGFRLTPLAPANVTLRPRALAALYRPEDVDRVARLAAPDITRFGYAFPG